MDALTIMLLSSLFLCAVFFGQMMWLLWSKSRWAQKLKSRKRLFQLSAGGSSGDGKRSVLNKGAATGASLLERMRIFPLWLLRLERKLLETGYGPVSLYGGFALGGAGFFLAYRLLHHPGLAILTGGAAAAIPWLWLKSARKRFVRKFEEQMPEALDLLARAVKSGHAISSGFEMVATQMAPPIKTEFAAMMEKINLGLSFHDALENMCRRVPSYDLRIFAVAVGVQKQTGGSISEILDKIARLIRERSTFRREVKTLTAEGKLSAVILILLPIFLAVYLSVVNYDYLSLLWTEPRGIYMSFGAAIAMIIGALVMKKIVSVDL